jgi:hypothetical protein
VIAAKRIDGQSRHHIGDRVTVTSGPFAGSLGSITRPAHAAFSPRFDWVVRFDQPVAVGDRVYASGAVADGELAAYTVPESARPESVGTLYHPGSDNQPIRLPYFDGPFGRKQPSDLERCSKRGGQ